MGSDQEASLPQFPSFRESGAKSKKQKSTRNKQRVENYTYRRNKEKNALFLFFHFCPFCAFIRRLKIEILAASYGFTTRYLPSVQVLHATC